MSFAEDLAALEAIREQLQADHDRSVEDVERIAAQAKTIIDRARAQLRKARPGS